MMMGRRAGDIEGAGSLIMLGGAWCIALITLAWGLPARSFALTFGVLFVAEASALILVRMGHALGGTDKRQDAVGQTLLGWVILSISAIALYRFDLLPFFAGQPVIVLMLLGLTLVLALMPFAGADRHPTRGQITMRVLLWILLWQAISYLDQLTVELALGGAILGALGLLFFGMAWQNGTVVPVNSSELYRQPQVHWASYIDVIVMPLLLSGGEALIYLVARAMAQVLISALAQIGAQAQSSLNAIGARRDGANFNALAARLNLGLLLVGGGLAVVLLAAGDYVPSLLGYQLAGIGPVLGWLLLAASAPAFFGATDTLLGLSAMQRHGTVLHLMAVAFFCAAAFGIPQVSAVGVAQLYAVTNLLQALIAAVLLARKAGVWPGLTAVLLRQIRLL